MYFKYYNPNKKNKSAGDCVIRMLTVVTKKSWEECYWMVCDEGEKFGDMPSANYVWMNILYNLGFKRKIVPDTCPACYSINDFCKDHPEGLFVVGTGSHVVAIENGKFLDSWNSGREVIIFYFEKL
jgi:hypothetical protein